MSDYILEFPVRVRAIVSAKHPMHAINRLRKAIATNGIGLSWVRREYPNAFAITLIVNQDVHVDLDSFQGDDWLPAHEQADVIDTVAHAMAEAAADLPRAQQVWFEGKMKDVLKGLEGLMD